ncbi:hypothetical protein CPC08DRAFT_769019 [Agrocybe pediades]|nr:hypothetical protein CPC08DRAFT_769019 [Agrocybe pediades]
MNSTDVSAVHPGIALTTGPRIIGFLFHYGLFGALTVQVYLYYLAFPRDPMRNKLLVYGVYALELTQTVMITHSAFVVFGSGYGDLSQFNNVSLAWFEVPIISGIVAFVAEAFYAYRISVLARSYWVAAVILLLALLQLGGGFWDALTLLLLGFGTVAEPYAT